MKSYLKFLSRNKLYVAIQAASLIVSLAFVVLIGNYVRQQWRVAHGAPEWKHYYAVGLSFQQVDLAPEGLAWLFRENVPAVEKAAMVSHAGLAHCSVGDVTFNFESIDSVEPDFFEMFPVEWITGDASALAGGGIAVHERIARQLPQDRDILGQEVVLGTKTRLPIVAVYRTLGAIFRDPGFLRVHETQELSPASFGGTVCLISSQVSQTELFPALDKALEMHRLSGFGQNESKTLEHGSAVRLDRLYFSDLNNGQAFRKGNLSLLRMLLAVVLLLLVSAVFNYINLNTALAGRRTKEMGMRAILGASRGQIMRSYLLESLLFTGVCAVLAVLLSRAFAPMMAHFVDTSRAGESLSVPFAWRWDAFTLCLYVGMVLLVSLLAGWIPARIAARYNPAQVVKGDYRLRSKRVFTKVFIVFQTALAVLLVAFSLVMERQYAHMIHRPVGADVENLYLQNHLSAAQEDALTRLPCVESVGRTSGTPGFPIGETGLSHPDGQQVLYMPLFECSPEAFRMFRFEVLEDFHTPGGKGVWLSESAFKAFGMSPGQKVLPDWVRAFRDEPLAGVLRDFAVSDAAHFDPARLGVVQVKDLEAFSSLVIRIAGYRKSAVRELEALYKRFSEEKYGYALFTESNGFISDRLRVALADAEKYMRLIELFMVLAVLVSLLGLLAMSTFFASEQTRDVAVRKVFGGTVGGEVLRGVREYMVLVGIACVLAIPVAVWMSGRYLEDYNYRISGYGWIFAVAVVIAAVISLVSVLWQTLRAARTNPATELKKE